MENGQAGSEPGDAGRAENAEQNQPRSRQEGQDFPSNPSEQQGQPVAGGNDLPEIPSFGAQLMVPTVEGDVNTVPSDMEMPQARPEAGTSGSQYQHPQNTQSIQGNAQMNMGLANVQYTQPFANPIDWRQMISNQDRKQTIASLYRFFKSRCRPDRVIPDETLYKLSRRMEDYWYRHCGNQVGVEMVTIACVAHTDRCSGVLSGRVLKCGSNV